MINKALTKLKNIILKLIRNERKTMKGAPSNIALPMINT